MTTAPCAAPYDLANPPPGVRLQLGLVAVALKISVSDMAAATGIPALLWVVLWIGISLVMITVGMRFYAVGKGAVSGDSVFED